MGWPCVTTGRRGSGICCRNAPTPRPAGTPYSCARRVARGAWRVAHQSRGQRFPAFQTSPPSAAALISFSGRPGSMEALPYRSRPSDTGKRSQLVPGAPRRASRCTSTMDFEGSRPQAMHHETNSSGSIRRSATSHLCTNDGGLWRRWASVRWVRPASVRHRRRRPSPLLPLGIAGRNCSYNP